MTQHSGPSTSNQTATDTTLTERDLDRISGGDIRAPRDSSTGQATGRRIELPITITTPVGTAS